MVHVKQSQHIIFYLKCVSHDDLIFVDVLMKLEVIVETARRPNCFLRTCLLFMYHTFCLFQIRLLLWLFLHMMRLFNVGMCMTILLILAIFEQLFNIRDHHLMLLRYLLNQIYLQHYPCQRNNIYFSSELIVTKSIQYTS